MSWEAETPVSIFFHYFNNNYYFWRNVIMLLKEHTQKKKKIPIQQRERERESLSQCLGLLSLFFKFKIKVFELHCVRSHRPQTCGNSYAEITICSDPKMSFPVPELFLALPWVSAHCEPRIRSKKSPTFSDTATGNSFWIRPRLYSRSWTQIWSDPSSAITEVLMPSASSASSCGRKTKLVLHGIWMLFPFLLFHFVIRCFMGLALILFVVW